MHSETRRSREGARLPGQECTLPHGSGFCKSLCASPTRCNEPVTQTTPFAVLISLARRKASETFDVCTIFESENPSGSAATNSSIEAARGLPSVVRITLAADGNNVDIISL